MTNLSVLKKINVKINTYYNMMINKIYYILVMMYKLKLLTKNRKLKTKENYYISEY